MAGPAGTAELDPAGKRPGRGAYVHPDRPCVEQARRRRALERALKVPVGPEVWAALESGPPG